MKKRYIVIPIFFLFLIFSLWGTTQSVVTSKLLELEVYIEKDFIQNFELSSQLLELQFKNTLNINRSRNLQNEINQQILASTVLNEVDTGSMEVTWFNTLGIGIINSIRLISFKPILDLLKELKLVTLLKYAFYLERNRNLVEAIKQYELIIRASLNKKTSTTAFALLHQSYCYALIGKIESSKSNLNYIITNYKGSGYDRTALVLKSLLSFKENNTKKLKNKFENKIELAQALFETGDLSQAKLVYDKMPIIKNPMDKYRYARSKEEAGEIKNAIKDYLKVVSENSSKHAAQLSNQRLLLIGNFYGGDKKTKEIAERDAIKLGNNEISKM